MSELLTTQISPTPDTVTPEEPSAAPVPSLGEPVAAAEVDDMLIEDVSIDGMCGVY